MVAAHLQGEKEKSMWRTSKGENEKSTWPGHGDTVRCGCLQPWLIAVTEGLRTAARWQRKLPLPGENTSRGRKRDADVVRKREAYRFTAVENEERRMKRPWPTKRQGRDVLSDLEEERWEGESEI